MRVTLSPKQSSSMNHSLSPSGQSLKFSDTRMMRKKKDHDIQVIRASKKHLIINIFLAVLVHLLFNSTMKYRVLK